MREESERDRRASDYVAGTMGEAERERAERDIVHDAGFREAVLRRAEDTRRQRSRAARPDADMRWNGIVADLSALPQMRAIQVPPATERRPQPAADKSVPARHYHLVVSMAGLAAAVFLAGVLAGRLSIGIF